MKMKYQKEWPELIKKGRKHGLTEDQLYFLLALREVESGSERNEFNIKVVKDTNFDIQTRVACESIIANEERWQRYIKEQSCMDFPSFFAQLGGPLGGGWHTPVRRPRDVWINELKRTMQTIREEFENESSEHSTVGETD